MSDFDSHRIPRPTRRDLPPDLAALAFLAGLWLLVWWPVVVGTETFYLRDFFFFFEPLMQLVGQAIRAGQFPGWNAASGGGAPLAADPNAGVFFPDSLLLGLLGAGAGAVRWVLLLRLLALPAAAYGALRWFGLPVVAALTGGVTCLLAGTVVSSLPSVPSHLGAAIVLLPLAAAAWKLRDRGWIELALAGAMPALALAAGSPDLAFVAGAILAVFTLRPPWRRTLPRFAAALLLAAAFAAPLLVPAARLYLRTPRAAGWPLGMPAGFLSVNPVHFAQLLWPGIEGNPLDAGGPGWWGMSLHDPGVPCWFSLSVGLLPLLLLPAAARDPRGRRFLLLAALFALLSLGRHSPLAGLVSHLPIVGAQRYPEKWLAGLFPALAGVAAVGLATIRSGDRRARRDSLLLGTAIGLVSTLLAVGAGLAPGGTIRAARALELVSSSYPAALDGVVVATLRREGLAAALLCLAFVLLLAMAGRSSALRTLAVPLLGLLLVADRLPRVRTEIRLVATGTFDHATPAVAAARAVAGDGRFFYDREATNDLDLLRPLTGSKFGLRYAANSDIDFFSDRRARRFVVAMQTLPFSDPRKGELLALGDVRAISTPDPAARDNPALTPVAPLDGGRVLYRLAGAAPARLFHRTVSASDDGDAFRRLLADGFPIRETAVVESGGEIASSPSPADRVVVRFPAPGRFSGEVSTAESALLLVSTTWDPNWTVTLDGEPAEVVPADAAFVGIPIPPGTHVVEGRFRDRSFLLGGAIAALALAILVALAVRDRRLFRSGPVPS